MAATIARFSLATVRAVDAVAHTATIQLGPSPTLLTGIPYACNLPTPAVDDLLLVLILDSPGLAPLITENLTSSAPAPAGSTPLGAIIMWSGTLGGTDNHHPVIGGVADTNWHLCNGDAIGSLTTPDLRDRFVVSSGTTYAIGDTGGAASLNLQHAHAVTVVAEATHTHPIGGGSGASAAGSAHSHGLTGNSGAGSTRLWERESPRVDWSEAAYIPADAYDENPSTAFQRNCVVWRAEGRWFFGALRPAGIVELDLSAGS